MYRYPALIIFSIIVGHLTPEKPELHSERIFVQYRTIERGKVWGKSSWMRPSSIRPAAFLPIRSIVWRNGFGPRRFQLSLWSKKPLCTLLLSRSIKSPPADKLPGAHSPHCLKWYATPAAAHWSRNDLAQDGCIGRAPRPLSPPTKMPSIVGGACNSPGLPQGPIQS